MAEETCIEILEMLKECLQCRQGPLQLEEPRGRSMGTRTTRMPAQAKFHAQTQVTYDHFGHLWDRQQESWKEALRVARDAQHWALAMVAMLEGHIEHLSHSVSHGQHSSQGQLASHQQSRNRGCSRSRRSCRGYPLAGRPPWGCCKEVDTFSHPCATQKVGHF